MRFLAAQLVVLLAAAAATAAAEDVPAVDYQRQVKPILQQHCYRCHGPLRQKSGLRLDHLQWIRQGGDGGSTLAAASGESRLIAAVRGDGDIERMPLEAEALKPEEIATLAAWIDQGAIAPEEPLTSDPRQHWSFQKPVSPPLPVVQRAAWATHPIDRFIAARHEQLGLAPAPPAPKNVLLRRVYLDLVGLPPTAAELRAFLADDAPEAYERVVDRLLASPRYGERWGRHWMDVWRYSDWDGYGAEVRESKPHIWRWRDWIIESLNADRPYDEMVRQMLAADELSPLDDGDLRAGGFLARNWYLFNRNVWMEATVEHTSKAFLGITLNCARCHDHMYDPILQTEYYQFRAFFEPHGVRAERLRGQADTKRDGLVRIYDAQSALPTYLFERGNEARPDKEHPLSPAVPRALGGDALEVREVNLPPTAVYPGLRDFVQQETLDEARGEVERSQSAMSKAATTLTDARQRLADFRLAQANSKPAEGAAGDGATAAAATAPPAETSEAALQSAVSSGEREAALAEYDMLAASAGLVAVRAKVAADRAAFAVPPAAEADNLAREASRAERVFNVEQSRRNLARLESQLAAAGAAAEEVAKQADAAKKAEAAKKKVTELEGKLAEARKARDAAQAALGQDGPGYQRFGEVFPDKSTGRRAALARWIASRNNPLTARVAINHIWLRHFGSPLVPTVFDFGLNGKAPTHPQLLDWLAVELMRNDWQMKSIHQLLVTSSAYRLQSTSPDEVNRQRDSENVYLWRANPRRMEAEAVRDSTLHVAGALDSAMFGPDLDPAGGLSVPRRSIYFRSSKEKKVTFLALFDSANVTDCYRRSETVVPQQALAMVNSSLSLGMARRLATALVGELATDATPDSQAAFVRAGFERVLCRPATAAELAACLEFLEAQSRRLAAPGELAAFAGGEENPIKPAADPAQRARENLVHVLLNHNDFLTVR